MSAIERECRLLIAMDYACWRWRQGLRLHMLAYARALGLDMP